MIRIFFCLLFLAFSFNTYAEGIGRGVLQTSINSVVSVYATSASKKSEIDEFFKSSNTSGDKGSGIIIGENGLIITNNHVIDNKSAIKIVLYDGRIFSAVPIAQDKELDLAILEIRTKNLKLLPIKMAKNIDNLEIGDTVYAVGNPFGIGLSVTSGIISALPSKNNTFSGLGKLIQTDASMNPGNSGGALLNNKGMLIGVNTGIFGDVFLGIGFAIPVDVVQLFINRAISGQKIRKYWLGFVGVDVTPEMIGRLGLQAPNGVIVTDVFNGGAGEKAGIRVGDVLLEIGDKKIESTATLSFEVAVIDKPNPIELTILRQKKIIKLMLTPEEPKDNIPSDITKISKGVLKNVVFANNSNAIAYEVDSDISEKGIVIYDISKNNFLYDLGAERGDILVSINGRKIATVGGLLKILDEIKNDVEYNIVLKRQGTEISFSVAV